MNLLNFIELGYRGNHYQVMRKDDIMISDLTYDNAERWMGNYHVIYFETISKKENWLYVEVD